MSGGFGMGTIFMLHRVFPNEVGKLQPNENMKVSPEFLENFILQGRKRGYFFISLDRMYDICRSGQKVSKAIVMTLDDGYADNFTHAYPIFKEHSVPFTIYVTTSFPDRTAILWWYSLEDLLLQNEKIELHDGSIYICKSLGQKADAFLQLRRRIIDLSPRDFLCNLQMMFGKYEIDWHKKVTEMAMSWDQIKKLSGDELATIGAHTINHYAPNTLSNESLREEIVGSKKIIELHTQKKVEHFCYPFGSHNEVGEREFSIVKTLNFKTATTTRWGNVHQLNDMQFYMLPRVMLSNHFSWPKLYWKSFKERILVGSLNA